MDIKSKAIESSARFSKCQNYRYELIRKFSDGPKTINFIMLNPSTADEFVNDPTIAKCENRAIALGYDRMVITNLFAYRATDPNDMKKWYDPIGNDNDYYIYNHATQSDIVVAAWGNHGSFNLRSETVKHYCRSHNIKLHALKINYSGEPSHPLYLANNLELFEWK